MTSRVKPTDSPLTPKVKMMLTFTIRNFYSREPLKLLLEYNDRYTKGNLYLDHATPNLPWDDHAHGKAMIGFKR